MARVTAAAIYARISSDQAGEALGVKRQVADCRKLARERGWTVAEEYVDNDVSAYSGKRRAEYERMLADVAAGRRDAVIVYNLDRLHRQPRELEAFLEVCDQVRMHNVATVTADIDLGNDDGLFMARVFAAFAAKESGRRSARVRRKLDEVAASGMPHGGSHRPFGYEADKMTVRPDEAEIIRILVKRYLAGESLRSLAAWLDREQVRTVDGGPWRTPTLRTMLSSGRIAGLREHRGEIVGPAAWKPIITPKQRDRVLLSMDQKKVSGRRAPRRYLLSGLLRCGKCGNKLFSSARADRRRYVCLSGADHGGCGRLTVVAAPVEELIYQAVLMRLDTPALAAALAGRAAQDEQATAVQKLLVEDQAQLDELADLYAAKEITSRDWLRAKKPIEQRMDEARRRLARLTSTEGLHGLVGNGAALRAQWEGLGLTQQAAIVAAVLDHAVILPGTSGARELDINRVQPTWRL